MARGKHDDRHRPGIQHTGSTSSEKQNKSTQSNISQNSAPGKRMPAFRPNERHFDMIVDGVPYSVRSTPFLFNDELRFRVCINGGAEHLFTWDAEASMLRAIDDDSSTIPSVVEDALNERLR